MKSSPMSKHMSEAQRLATRVLGRMDGFCWREQRASAADELAEAVLVLCKQAERWRRLAKNAKSIGAAPDYDEEAIRAALWALVDDVAAVGVVRKDGK